MSNPFDVNRLLRTLNILCELKLTVRDVVMLRAIMVEPGMCGTDLCRRLKIPNHSSVVKVFERLMNHGFITDLRTHEIQGSPSRYYITAAGTDFWQEIAL